MQTPESASRRSLRPILVVESASGDGTLLRDPARAAGLLPRTLPGPERARVQLAREDERLEALVVFASGDGATAQALVREARTLRPSLPVVVVAANAEAAARLERALAGADSSAPPPRVVCRTAPDAVARAIEAAAGARSTAGSGGPAGAARSAASATRRR